MKIQGAVVPILACTFLSGLVGGLSLGQTALPAATQPAASWNDRLMELRNSLASDSYAQRENAQRDLSRVPPEALNTLHELAAKENDPEVRIRLDNGIREIEANFALQRPRLSLNVENQTLDVIFKRLNADMGFGEKQVVAGQSNATFTLKVKDATFWEIIKELDRQHPLSVDAGSRWLFTTGVAGGTWHFPPNASFAMRTSSWNTDKFADGMPPSWTIQTLVLLDPRLPAKSMTSIKWTEFNDDQGNNLLLKGGPAAITPPALNAAQSGIRTPIPANPGKTIASAKGSFVVTAAGGQRIFFDDILQKLNQPIQHNPGTLTIDQPKPGDTGSLRLTLVLQEVKPESLVRELGPDAEKAAAERAAAAAVARVAAERAAAAAAADRVVAERIALPGLEIDFGGPIMLQANIFENGVWAGKPLALRKVGIEISDATGRRKEITLTDSSVTTLDVKDFTHPIRVTITPPEGDREFKFPVELKDIPLP